MGKTEITGNNVKRRLIGFAIVGHEAQQSFERSSSNMCARLSLYV